MKKIVYISVLVAFTSIISNSTFAQIRKVPAEVTDAFAQKYPGASGVEWRDKLSGFTASYNLDSISYVATFNNKGEWESTEQEIEQDNLPEVVKDGLSKSKYAEWNVSHVTKIELPDDELQYRIEVGKGDIKKRNLYYNSKGRLLKDKLTL